MWGLSNKIYLNNTLTRKKEVFKPLKKKHVSIYHCGPTVYSKQHLGNISAHIFTDVLQRLFEYSGNKVDRVINITDVGHLTDDADSGEDKIEKTSRIEGRTAQDISKEFTDKFMKDLKELNIKVDSISFPKATDYIQEQIDLIQRLEKKGYAYQITDGIYYDTSKFKKYGKLGSIDIEGLKEGARVEGNKEKRNPTDFALWKFSQEGENRQQEWNSPWGIGFPGWHIECSAMSQKLLGDTLDIHIGGIEHVGVHHNNEIAQSEVSSGKKFVNYWMHFNHLMLNGEKISKSVGNVLFVDDLIAKGIPPHAFRYWLLTSSYSTPTNFTWDAVNGAKTAYDRLVNFVKENKTGIVHKVTLNKMLGVIRDDLNTAQAIAMIWEMMKDESITDEDKKATIIEIDKILGTGIGEGAGKTFTIPDNITKLAQQRDEARKRKDFETSDKIRDEIKEAGYEVKDTDSGFEIEKI